MYRHDLRVWCFRIEFTGEIMPSEKRNQRYISFCELFCLKRVSESIPKILYDFVTLAEKTATIIIKLKNTAHLQCSGQDDCGIGPPLVHWSPFFKQCCHFVSILKKKGRSDSEESIHTNMQSCAKKKHDAARSIIGLMETRLKQCCGPSARWRKRSSQGVEPR